jgi:hypothetical protein
VKTADAAVAAASELGGPVVIKAVAEGLLHKSDLGLVVTNIIGDDAVRRTADGICAAAARAGLNAELLVVEQVSGALDVVVGYKRDPQFGPTTLVGLGGVWTEWLDSVSVHVGPMDLTAAHTLLDTSHAGRMMREARGGMLDFAGVAHALVAITDLGIAHPEVVAIDVNPVIVGRHHATAVDAVIERDDDHDDTGAASTERTVRLNTITEGATP